MKQFTNLVSLLLLILPAGTHGQDTSIKRIPFLDSASQSNVVVTISDLFGPGFPCPPASANSLSNRTLFSEEQERDILGVFESYTDTSTNRGPVGTELISLHTTNRSTIIDGKTFKSGYLVASFLNTNSGVRDEIVFSSGFSARRRDKENSGYNLFFVKTGRGLVMRYTEIYRGVLNGLAAEFDCPVFYTTNIVNLAGIESKNMRLYELMHYTNGLVFGEYWRWDPATGNILISAEFTHPYDWNKHYHSDFNRKRDPH